MYENIVRHVTAVTLAAALMCLPQFSRGSDTVFEDRAAVINFEGQLVDSSGLPFDGIIAVEAHVYTAAVHDPADPPLYGEVFADVAVERGRFRVPLFGGTPLTAPVSVEQLSMHREVYLDLIVDGAVVLEGQPLGSSFAALRAERAQIAEGVRSTFVLDPSQLPSHSALLVTNGELDPARLPMLTALQKITSGTFQMSQVPAIPAGSVTGGPFLQSQMPSNINVAKFTSGTLADSLITTNVIRAKNIALESGTSGHNGYIDVPQGFDRSQCKLLVGLREIDGHSGIDQFHASWSPTGEVECTWSYNEMGTQQRGCTLNYLMVCKK